MKLPIIIFLTAILSSNYVMSQTRCPPNGILTNDGACFYLSSSTCPKSLENEGIPQNEAEFSVVWELLRRSKSMERICMSITDSDLKSVLDHQPYYIRKLKEDKQVFLNLPIEDNDALHVVFKITNPDLKSTFTIAQSSRNNSYIGRIEIFKQTFTLSTSTEIPINPEIKTLEPNSGVYYDIIIRFIRGNIQIINNVKHTAIAKIDISLNLDYLADMITIENMEVIQLEYQNMKCQNGETYRKNSPAVLRSGSTFSSRSFDRSVINKFNLNTEFGSHELTLQRRNDWAENFTFHLLGQNISKHLDFKLIFDTNSDEASFVYTCSEGYLSINYQKRVWKSILGFGGHYKYVRIDGRDAHLQPSTSEFTISMSQEENQKLKISMETDSWVESDTIDHPCVDEMKDCDFNKDVITIKTTSSYISGFRFEKESISTYCSSDHWISEFTPQIFYRDHCSAEKPLNLCRIKVHLNTESQKEISSDKTVETSEQKESLGDPTMDFAREHKYNKWEILAGNTRVFVTSCLFVSVSVFLSLVNTVFEYLYR